jgi:hypothetical protein
MLQPAQLTSKIRLLSSAQAVIQKVPKRDIQIVLGDINAKTREDNDNWWGTIGRDGLGQMNENGLLFTDFCALNDLVIGSLFPQQPHPQSHMDIPRPPNRKPD